VPPDVLVHADDLHVVEAVRIVDQDPAARDVSWRHT